MSRLTYSIHLTWRPDVEIQRYDSDTQEWITIYDAGHQQIQLKLSSLDGDQLRISSILEQLRTIEVRSLSARFNLQPLATNSVKITIIPDSED